MSRPVRRPRLRHLLVHAAPTSLGVLLLAACTGSGPSSADGSSAPADTTAAAPTIVTEPPPGVDAATDEPAAGSGGVVDPVIASSMWYADTSAVEVSGYVSGVVEDGGTCSVVMTLGDRRVQVDAPGTADATTTTCGTISVPGDQLSAGTWEVRLLYSSASSNGTSAAASLEVPA